MTRNKALEAKLFKKKTTGINFDKYNDIKVDVSGENVPEPLKQFSDGKFHEVLASNIELAGYANPTPVQKYAVPITLSGRDLMSCAQTGSGKTAAFLFPVLSLLLTTDAKSAPKGGGYRRKAFPSALIMTPTRELALQIHDEASKFTYRTGLASVAVYGGQRIGDQIREIQRGCNLVIATPGRLADMLEREILSLSMIKFLIFDEADQMLDMGFERDIRKIVEEYDMPRERQTSMFSATFPRSIQMLAGDFLNDYIFLAVGRVGSATENITQKVVYTKDVGDKDDALMRTLSTCEGLTIIFVETKRKADFLEGWLIDQRINAVSIHGDRSQYEREEALQIFRDGKAPVLVATSVAARGLDIPNVTMVINYDLPSKFEDYVHRIGRTGRAGNTGNAVAFVNEQSRNLDQLLQTMKDSNQTVEDWFLKMVRASGGSRYNNRRGGGGRQPQRDFRNNNSGNQRDVRSNDRFGQRNNYGSQSYNQGPPVAAKKKVPSQRDFPTMGGSSNKKQVESDSDSDGAW